MPFIDSKFKEPFYVKIAETEYANPENETDVLKLSICVPNVAFNNEKLTVSIN